MPLVVLLALVFTLGRSGSGDATAGRTGAGSSGGVLPPVTVEGADPPASATAACTTITEGLPVKLAGLAPRVVHGPQFAVAWGDPAVVLRCGVTRPAELKPASAAFVQLVGAGGTSAAWLPSKDTKFTRWTLIDRSVYVEVLVPATVPGSAVLAAVTPATKSLPVLCQTQDPTAKQILPRAQLCVYRK